MGSMLGTIVKALCAQNDREQSRSPRPSIFHQSAVTDQNQVIPQPHLEGHFCYKQGDFKMHPQVLWLHI